MQFAWSAGEPDPDHWETAGMLRYLELCAAHPDQLGIALHEYSYDKNDIWRLNGELIGRFRRLFEVCDRRAIRRPKLIMSEWGWTHRRVPDRQEALTHIEEVSRLYARYPEILGAAIWYLGGGPEWSNICNQTQRLIEPVTEFSRTWRIEVEPERPAPPAPPTPSEVAPPPSVRVPGSPRPITVLEPERPRPALISNAVFVADATIPDDTPVTAGTSFTKSWRIRNTGQTSWDAGYKLVFIGGDPLGDLMAADVPATEPGKVATISVPMRAPLQKEGTVFGDWRLTTPEGDPFGDIFYVRITVTPPPPSDGVNGAAFIADVTIPDDSVLEPGEAFSKSWKIKNNGSKAWGSGYRLAFVGGANLSGGQAVPLPAARPGELVTLSIPMTAPITPGVHWADWRPQDPRGDFFGDIVYVRITVPAPAAAGGRIRPLSQNDPAWKKLRLGDSLSDQTIGDWGCLLTVFAMIANAYGKELSPADLNERILRKRLFLDHKLTPWNTLANLYTDIIYDGRLEARRTPNLTERIDAALKAGHPVAVQVDYTPHTSYTPNDQHWVLIVGREGNDYRINDPWLYPSTETSLRMRYARPGKLLRDSILAAIFYRSSRPQESLPVVGSGVLSVTDGGGRPVAAVLQTGINIDPLLPNSDPREGQQLKGLGWVRFVYKIAAQPDPARRNLRAAFELYDETIRTYQRLGTGALIVLNQETVWGNAPWSGDGDWGSYIGQLAQVASRIAGRYARFGDGVAYEIWHKQDIVGEPAAVPVAPAEYARLLDEVGGAIRAAAPRARIISGGLVGEENGGVAYLREVREALGGRLPVDAIGVQPYGRWGTHAPFDWGQSFGPLGGLIDTYQRAFADLPLWITEVGVAGSSPIDRVHDREIGDYMADLFRHAGERLAGRVPVMVWYAWSDLMNHAGVVDVDGRPKGLIFEAFRRVRDKEQ